jgi:hypothetical protein
MTATLIVPCAAPLRPGEERRPKWMLTTPDGRMLVVRAAGSIPQERVARTIVVLLQDTEQRYGASEAVRRAFGREVETLVLDEPTGGPAATVRQAVATCGVTGPLLIKDSDGFFAPPDQPLDGSFIAVSDLRAMPSVSEPGRKSYVRINEQGLVADIHEKNVVSNYISVGLYGFADATQFADGHDALTSLTGTSGGYVSHVVKTCLAAGHVFQPLPVEGLVDIGTRADWNAYRARLPTIVLDIDGVIFRNQSQFFPPYWTDPVEPIAANVAHARSLQARGAQLVFMTARPEALRPQTLAALQAQGLHPHALVMGCHHGTRFLVNDYAPSNPYPSAVAVNLRRNSPDLPDLLLEDHRSLDREP